jgi:hypothetical protein
LDYTKNLGDLAEGREGAGVQSGILRGLRRRERRWRREGGRAKEREEEGGKGRDERVKEEEEEREETRDRRWAGVLEAEKTFPAKKKTHALQKNQNCDIVADKSSVSLAVQKRLQVVNH